MKLLLYITVLLIVFTGVSVAETPVHTQDKAQTDLVVSDNKGSELQLEVREMPLAQVLKSIAEKTHVPIHYSVLPEGLVTATCVGVSLKPVLECLLNRKADIIVRYSRDNNHENLKGQIAEAWILGSKLEASSTNGGVCRVAAQGGSISLSRKDEVTEAAPGPEAGQIDELIKITQSENATERAEAIGALLGIGHKHDPKIRVMLEEALHDQDADVRAQAISTLSHLEGNEVAGSALQEALRDSSPDVRLMAVDSITDDVALLQQAVNDSDETVRSVAILKLEEITQGNKTKP